MSALIHWRVMSRSLVMPRRVLCSSLLVVGLVSLGQAQQTTPDPPSSQPQAQAQGQSSQSTPPRARFLRRSFQTGIDVVSLAVTVTDPQQKLVGNLQRGDFSVFEDGVPQELAYFETGDVPLDLTLLIDTSASMEGKLGFVRKAATGFTTTLRAGDRASVVGFNNRVSVLQPFTEDLGSPKTSGRSSAPSNASPRTAARRSTTRSTSR
jgi:Mg-chelatase subunit ChlD